MISYDDFNPYLDSCRAAMRATEHGRRCWRSWRLQDHMDAILSLGVTKLVDLLTSEKVDADGPHRSTSAATCCFWRRFTTPRRASRSRGAGAGCAGDRASARSGRRRDLQIGFGTTLLVVAPDRAVPVLERPGASCPGCWCRCWPAGSTGAGGWRAPSGLPAIFARACASRAAIPSALRWELLWFKPTELGGQPLPTASRGGAEERYELLRKFQGVLNTLGYKGIVVLIDRVDEPQQVEGDPRKMRALIWPLLDHKFLRHPGIGFKLLLPIELAYYLEKENKEFYDRARPDKLNMIKPLRWTGPSLYDLASDRLRACRPDPSANGEAPRLRQLHRRRDQRRLSQGRPGKPAHASAPLQVLAPADRGALPPPHRGRPALDGRLRHLPHDLRGLHARPRGVRPRLWAWVE